MHRTRITLRIITCSLLITSTLCDFAVAQISWLRPESNREVTVQLLLPHFNHELLSENLHSVWFASARLAVSSQIAIVAELPLAHYETEGWLWADQKGLFGNPYLGLVFLSPGNSGLTGSVGARLPIAQKVEGDVAELAALGAFDRYEAFLPDLLTLSASVGYHVSTPEKLTFKCRIGPTLLHYTPCGHDDEQELLIDYDGEVRLQPGRFCLAWGISGRFLLASDYASELDFGERITNMAGLAATYDAGKALPGLYLQIPLDSDLQDFVDYTVGVNLTSRF